MASGSVTDAVSSHPVFTPDPVEQLRDMLGDDLVVELVDEFETSSLDALVRLDAAVASGDAKTCQREVHGLKSAAASLGLMSLSALCLALETLCRDGEAVTAEHAGLVRESYRTACGALSHLKV